MYYVYGWTYFLISAGFIGYGKEIVLLFWLLIIRSSSGKVIENGNYVTDVLLIENNAIIPRNQT